MKALVALAVAVVLMVMGHPARADEVAPALERQDLRAYASAQLDVPSVRASQMTGLYLAFDPDPTDAIAQAACDDDGDPVVVLSDAMLGIVSRVIMLSIEEDRAALPGHVVAYAEHLAKNQAPGKPLLPPASGAFSKHDVSERARYVERLFETLQFLLVSEIEHHRNGDLSCPHPTATKERGDNEWTAAEKSAAAKAARTLSARRQREADEAAVRAMSGGNDGGPVALLRFFGAYENRTAPAAVIPSYVTTHPGSAARVAHVKALVAAAVKTTSAP